MSNKYKMMLSVCVTTTFILGLFSGFVMYDFAATNSSLAAKCKSVDGNYGGGKCYKKGVEVTN